ncbi:substrate-binding domain-containing protein [Streptomyces sp. NBC_00433]
MAQPRLEARRLAKRFGHVRALQAADCRRPPAGDHRTALRPGSPPPIVSLGGFGAALGAAQISTGGQDPAGISTGLQAAGKQGKVKVAAFDAEPDEITALTDGTLDVLVAQDPGAIGRQGVDQALAAIDKKKVTAHIGTDMVAITKADMDQPDVKKFFHQAAC